jgi:hypothetical protein
MRSEWLHYTHALFMLAGLYYFKDQARSWRWWTTTLLLQQYHHLEHLILLLQALIRVNLLNSPVPISLGQLWFPRLELHFAYNLMVLVPWRVAFYPIRKKPIGDSNQFSSHAKSSYFINFDFNRFTLQLVNVSREESQPIASSSSHHLTGIFSILGFY